MSRYTRRYAWRRQAEPARESAWTLLRELLPALAVWVLVMLGLFAWLAIFAVAVEP